MSSPGSTTIIRKRKRRRNRKPSIFPLVLAAVAIGGVLWGAGTLLQIRRVGEPQAARLTGYVGSPANLQQEYQRYYGKPLADTGAISRFEQAGRLASDRDYPGALAALESISNNAALPVVFTD